MARYAQAPPKVRPRNDAYTGLLVISLLAMMIGCLLLFLDYSQYPDTTPPALNLPPVSGAPSVVKPKGPAKKDTGKADTGKAIPPDDKKKEEPKKTDDKKKEEPKKTDDKKTDDKKTDDKKKEEPKKTDDKKTDDKKTDDKDKKDGKEKAPEAK